MSDSDSLTDYVRVSPNVSNFAPENIIPFTPTISQSDHIIGEITRYFVRFNLHNTSADITEIDKKTYTTLLKNPLYTTTSVRWLVAGPLDDFEKSGILMPGVITANQKSIALAEDTMPGITDYITDYQKFWSN